MVEGPEGAEAEVSVPDPMVEFVALVKDMMEKISEKMKSMEEKVEEVKAEFNAFKKEPAGKKISDGKTDFNKQLNSDDVVNDRLAAITAMRKK
jgi:tetrahydromethanopterin S-methyltransferase subunit G